MLESARDNGNYLSVEKLPGLNGENFPGQYDELTGSNNSDEPGVSP